MVNLYKLLGIHPTATQDQIQKALVKAAQSQSASLEQLQKVRATLLNAEARKKYDAMLRQQHPDAWNTDENVEEERPPAKPAAKNRRKGRDDNDGGADKFNFLNKVFPLKTWHLALICAAAFGAGWISDRLYIQYRVTSALSDIAEKFGRPHKSEKTDKKSEEKDDVPTTWEYSQTTDKMRGTTSETATLASENQENLGFPYENVRAGLLMIKGNQDVGSVIIFVTGQLDCRTPSDYDACEIAVKFDNQEIEYISVRESDGNTSVKIDEQHRQRFVDKVRRAKKLTIELPMYKTGGSQFTFNLSGFKW